MGWILDLLRAIGRNLKTWMLMSENLNELKAAVRNCKTDIKSVGNDVQGTRNIVIRIDEYGSKGAMAGIAKLEVKLDKMSEKLDERDDRLHRRVNDVEKDVKENAVEIARLKGRMNGHDEEKVDG